MALWRALSSGCEKSLGFRRRSRRESDDTGNRHLDRLAGSPADARLLCGAAVYRDGEIPFAGVPGKSGGIRAEGRAARRDEPHAVLAVYRSALTARDGSDRAPGRLCHFLQWTLG